MTIRHIAPPYFAFAAALAAGIASAALVVGTFQFRSIVDLAVTRELDAAHSAQKFMQEQQSLHQEAVSQTLASNASFVGYVAQSLAAVDVSGKDVDVASIRDLLDERRRDGGFIAAAIYDIQGKLIAGSGENLFARGNEKIQQIVDRSVKGSVQASIVFDEHPMLPLVTATPLMRGTEVVAVLATAQPSGEHVLRDMARVTNTDLALVQLAPQGAKLIASTLNTDEAQTVQAQIATLDFSPYLSTDKAGDKSLALRLGEHGAFARVEPLLLSNGKAFLITIAPHAATDELRSEIARPLAIAAGAALLLLLSGVVVYWRRTLRPLADLDELFDRAARGDHALEFRGGGGGIAARIGDGFNHLQKHLQRHRVTPGTPRRRVTDSR